MAFAVTGCGGAAQEPDEFADIWFQSFADGDYEAYRGSLATDAVLTDQLGDSYLFFDDHPWLSGFWGVEDFDGDGSVSFADRYQARIALVGVDPLSVEWGCATVTQDQAECTVTTVDAAGGPPIVNV